MTSRPTSLLAAAALLSLGACGGASGPSASTAETSAGGPVRFVQQTSPDVGVGQGAREGVLRLDDAGCFRVGAGPALVWPAEAALDLTEPGVVRVTHQTSGASVRVGEPVRVSGGESAPEAVAHLNRPLGPCEGPVWDVEAFEARVAAPVKNARGALFPFA